MLLVASVRHCLGYGRMGKIMLVPAVLRQCRARHNWLARNGFVSEARQGAVSAN